MTSRSANLASESKHRLAHSSLDTTNCPRTTTDNTTGSIPSVTTSQAPYARRAFNGAAEISAYIFGVHKKLLLDTGAQRSSMSFSAFKALPKHSQILQSADTLHLCGANREPLQIQARFCLI